ncbi:putative FBD-associated F-box protein At5g56560 [Triticum urartu]|uniref:putative FBD-associated F-box protein At5g56560 n=1 Tax=Triticum urartu TaxID=4572 RepID=UPI002043CE36|nr:putative FBD-associated F-box protein At5g56560 [Triticum urartu]
MESRSGPRLRFPRQQFGRAGSGGADRISALPDDLLLLVLAGLHCTRAAARTGVLCRRWRGLWARLHQIVLRDVAFDSIEPALGRVSPAVSLLEIHVPAERSSYSPRVNSLLRAAARLEPEELFLDLSSALIGDSLVIVLPCFHRTSSITLGLFSDIHVPAGVEFTALETLYLGSCIDALDSLLSSCPRLRTLHLSGTVLNEPYVRVNSATLLELVVDNKRTHSINIVAPLLK